MAITFYLSNTNSDLTGGTNFNKQLNTATESASTISQTLGNSATATNYAFTNAGVPGVGGVSTGTFTITVNVTTANNNITIAIALARVNSAGTQQAVTAYTATQSAGTTGVKTFTFTDPALGTWAAGDRLRVQYQFVNAAMNNQTVVIETGTVSTSVDTPFYPAAATLYWVGGPGTWDTYTAIDWAQTSGGTGGYSYPTATTDVVFDVNSDAGTGFTVTASTGATCKNITVSGLDQTMTLAGSAAVNVYGNLSFPAANLTLTYTGTLTFAGTSGTQTITTNGVTFDCPLTFSGIGGTFQLQDNFTTGSTRTATLTAGTLDLNTKTLSTGIFASSNSNTRTLAFGASGQLALTGNAATIFDLATASNFSTTGTVYVNSSYTGATGTRTFNTGFSETQANAGYSVATSGSSGIVIGTTATDTVALTGSYASINLSGFTNTLSNTARTVYGDLTLPASGGTFTSGTSVTTFGATSGTKTITTNGCVVPNPLTFSGAGGTFQLQDDITFINISGVGILTLTAGTFDANNKNVTTRGCIITGTNTRTLTMGSGLWTLTGGTVWDATTTTNLTFNKNTANIVLSDTSTLARTFNGGGLTYNKLTIGGTTGTSTLTISGSNTFSELASTKTVAHTITFTGGTTTTTAAWSITGTAGNVVTLNTSDNSAATLLLSGGGYTTGVDYLTIRSVVGNPISDTWYIGSNSTLDSTTPNVTYGFYTTARTSNVVIVLTSTSSATWSVPVNWNNSNNTIHLVGAGGGGAGSGNATYRNGAGGGGGGYTKLTNQSLFSGASITYQCGSAGTAGTTANDGGDGGTTSWNSGASTAGGGGGGKTAGTAGAAGVGTTYNGGAGGAGVTGNATTNLVSGSGGGGAGFINGNGGAGGPGSPTNAALLALGGGGGGNGGGTNGGTTTTNSGGNNASGVGGGVSSGLNGSFGGGASGETYLSLVKVGPGNAGPGTDIFNGIGGGGGCGGGRYNSSTPVSVPAYGSGGGGGGVSTAIGQSGGAGGQGIIIITYVPTIPNSFFSLFA